MKISRFLLACGMMLVAGSLVFAPPTARADDATWSANPVSGDWNISANWTPATVPNGRGDIATFGVSSLTTVTTSSDTTVDQIVFNPGADNFTIVAGFDKIFSLSGAGIVNDSGVVQNLLVPKDAAGFPGILFFLNEAAAGSDTLISNNGEILFYDSSSAGNGTFTNETSTVDFHLGGRMTFLNSSSAGNAMFTNGAELPPAKFQGGIIFYDDSTAGNATFLNEGTASSSLTGGAYTAFIGNSSAGNATFTLYGSAAHFGRGGELNFYERSTAGNATIMALRGKNRGPGGQIGFTQDSDGGTARIAVFGQGTLDLSGHSGLPVTVGSVEGNGLVKVVFGSLTVGSNNLDTTFSGVISGDGFITKRGRGRWSLTGENVHTGLYNGGVSTVVRDGSLLVDNTAGSGTGTGSVRVRGGTLGGTGIIAGAVEVGAAGANHASISPGASANAVGTLTILSDLTFHSTGRYLCSVNTGSVISDRMVADGVTIETGAEALLREVDTIALPPGTVFTIIDNTAPTPISGTFDNLADGSVLSVGVNTFQASYSGGDGNDLTLTVVP